MEDKFLDAMMFRHACKEFDDSKKISDEDFAKILEIGRLSPSSFGFEPWKFLVIQDTTLRSKLKEIVWGAQGTLPSASHYLIILARKKPSLIHGSDYVEHMLHNIRQLPQEAIDRYHVFYKAFQESDFDLLKNDRYMFDWACRQTYIALANMLTGAAYMGIDSCPVEGFVIDQMNDFVSKELAVDTEEFGVSVMAAFGYRKIEPREKTRQKIEDITTWY